MFLTKSVEKPLVHTIKEIRHDLLLNFSKESLLEGTTRKPSQVYVELPYPIHKPLTTKCTKDTVKEFVKAKEEYNKLLNNKRRCFKTEKKNIAKEKIGGKQFIHIPRHFWEFYTTEDPDPYFNSDFNYYYTGGVLEYIECDNNQYLIRPDTDNYLQAYNLVDHENIRLDFSLPSTIYGMDSATIASDVLLLLREKQNLHVTSLNCVQNIETKTKWLENYKDPIFDAKFVENNPSHIGIISSDSRFTVRDIDTNKDIYSFKNSDAKFRQFQSLQEQLFVLVDGFNIKVIDTRTREVENFEPGLLACNPICTFKVLDNSLLLASRHYIMKCDLRYLESISHYSHSLVHPPTYLEFVEKRGNTYLCVAGQDPENKVLFTRSSAYSLPYKVPGILTALKECRLENPKITLLDFLDTRLNFSTTGLKVLDINKEVCIYSTNCLGEIFKQTVSDNQIQPQYALKSLLEWIDDVEKPVPALVLTGTMKMHEAWLSMKKDPIKKKPDKYRVEISEQFLAKFGERYSRRKIKGTLARDFSDVWGEDEFDEEIESLPEVPVHDKVNNWIQMNDFEDEPSFTSLNLSKGSQ